MEALTSGSGGQIFLFRLYLYLGYVRTGRHKEARAESDYLQGLAQDRYLSPTAMAALHAWLGDNDRAFALLEEARRVQDPWLRLWVTMHIPEATSEDPRYAAFLDTLVPNNPWKRARYDDNGVLLNPDFINEIE